MCFIGIQDIIEAWLLLRLLWNFLNPNSFQTFPYSLEFKHSPSFHLWIAFEIMPRGLKRRTAAVRHVGRSAQEWPMGLGQAQGTYLAERPAEFLVGSSLLRKCWVWKDGMRWKFEVTWIMKPSNFGAQHLGTFEPYTVRMRGFLSSSCPYQIWMRTDEPVLPQISKIHYHYMGTHIFLKNLNPQSIGVQSSNWMSTLLRTQPNAGFAMAYLAYDRWTYNVIDGTQFWIIDCI